MYNFFSYTNLSKSLKNLLIFVPIFLSNKSFETIDFYKLLIGFILFSIITNIIYIINDYKDKDIDKKNILKKKINSALYLSKKSYFFFNFFLFCFLIIIYFLGYLNKFIIFYLLNFYLYTYILKQIKYIDIISLQFFYVARFGYGAELAGVELSLWFVIFFSSLFVILASSKRLIQIIENNLIKVNKIIPYDISNILTLKIIISVFSAVNLTIILLFFFKDYLMFSEYFSSPQTKLSYSLTQILIVLFFYFLNGVRILYNLFNAKIKIDIFQYVARDRLIIVSFVLITIILKLTE
jgi:4-hydroxybenzoate polyprenyltransferase